LLLFSAIYGSPDHYNAVFQPSVLHFGKMLLGSSFLQVFILIAFYFCLTANCGKKPHGHFSINKKRIIRE
jgi:hypothetical protein